jgi:hypothetical protein
MLKACVMFPSQWWLLGGHRRRFLYALLTLLLPGSPANSRKLAQVHSSPAAGEGAQGIQDQIAIETGTCRGGMTAVKKRTVT